MWKINCRPSWESRWNWAFRLKSFPQNLAGKCSSMEVFQWKSDETKNVSRFEAVLLNNPTHRLFIWWQVLRHNRLPFFYSWCSRFSSIFGFAWLTIFCINSTILASMENLLPPSTFWRAFASFFLMSTSTLNMLFSVFIDDTVNSELQDVTLSINLAAVDIQLAFPFFNFDSQIATLWFRLIIQKVN